MAVSVPLIDRSLDRAKLRRAPGLPGQIHLSVTDRCFLPCLHCDIWKNDATDLPGQVWIETLDRLAEWIGPASVNFVGGEPLLRKDLGQLMGHAVKLGNTVTFNTNAWLLTEKRAAEVADAGVSIAYISMDGFSAETVDFSRGREGSRQKCLDAWDLLDQHASPRVVISCILNENSAPEIPQLLDLVKRRNAQLVVHPLYQTFGNAIVYDKHWYKASPLWPRDLTAINDALDLLTRERFRGGPVCNSVGQLQSFKGYYRAPGEFNGLTCKAGHSDLAFDPQGNIRLCYFLEPVATVFDWAPLAAIWDLPKTLRRRWEVSRCERSCNLLNCNFDRNDL